MGFLNEIKAGLQTTTSALVETTVNNPIGTLTQVAKAAFVEAEICKFHCQQIENKLLNTRNFTDVVAIKKTIPEKYHSGVDNYIQKITHETNNCDWTNQKVVQKTIKNRLKLDVLSHALKNGNGDELITKTEDAFNNFKADLDNLYKESRFGIACKSPGFAQRLSVRGSMISFFLALTVRGLFFHTQPQHLLVGGLSPFAAVGFTSSIKEDYNQRLTTHYRNRIEELMHKHFQKNSRV